MLTYLSSGIWVSPAQMLFNTVNVVGLLGKGKSGTGSHLLLLSTSNEKVERL